jgi:3-hydroxyisobutyrate dehydrogenase-like beta-hydroxyacid dehydrogenase
MALRLLEEGFDVRVHDLRNEAVRACVDEGAQAAGSIAASTEGADVVAIAVLDDDQVTEVVSGSDGVLAHAKDGALVLLHSTILPWTAQALAEQAAARLVGILDAPVSGGAPAARRGELSVMIGGDADDVERARPVLEAEGTPLHLGPSGAGCAGKLANQLMTFCNQLGALEAMKLAHAYDISEEAVAEAAMLGTGDSWIVRNWGFFDEVMREYDRTGTPEPYRPWAKDLWDITVVARRTGLSLPMAGLAAQLSTRAFRERLAELEDGEPWPRPPGR